MDIVIYIVIVVWVFYYSLITAYIVGLYKSLTKKRNTNQTKKYIFLSIIVAFRNEEKSIQKLTESILNQTLAKNKFEVILIDDFSDDNSLEILKKEIRDFENCKILNQNESEQGKKKAILKGVSIAKGNYIVTTDADCVLNPEHLQEIYNTLSSENIDMLVGAVKFTGNSLFQKFQILEFLSLQASTIGAVGIEKATMCNGANLVYKKSLLENKTINFYENLHSGDDVFLLHSVKNNSGKIKFLNSDKTIVKTEAEKTLKDLIRQRLRWVSKSKFYKDFDTILSSLIVFFTNLLIVSMFVSAIISIEFLNIALLSILIKSIVDFAILYKAASFYKLRKTLILFPVLAFVYPFYVFFISVFGLFVKKTSWKKRKSN